MRFAAFLLLLAVFAQRPASWLDQPLTNWNRPGAVLPAAPAPAEPLTAVISRCRRRLQVATQHGRSPQQGGFRSSTSTNRSCRATWRSSAG
jgi:hypothetical protein